MLSNNSLLILISRYAAEYGAQIAAIYNQHLDSVEESLLRAIKDMYPYTNPANIICAPVVLIYTVVKNVQQKLIFKIERQDIGPRFQLAYALISITLDVLGAIC